MRRDDYAVGWLVASSPEGGAMTLLKKEHERKNPNYPNKKRKPSRHHNAKRNIAIRLAHGERLERRRIGASLPGGV